MSPLPRYEDDDDVAGVLSRVDAERESVADPDDWVQRVLDEADGEEESALAFDVEDVRHDVDEFAAKLGRPLTQNEAVAMLHHLSEQWDRGDDFDTQGAFDTYYRTIGEKPIGKISEASASDRQRFMIERYNGYSLTPTEDVYAKWEESVKPVHEMTNDERQAYMIERTQGRPPAQQTDGRKFDENY